MAWFDDIKQVLAAYYPPTGLPDVVGYLRGSKDTSVWRNMEQGNRNQMMILGSRPPTAEDWSAAGVLQRGSDQTITLRDLTGFIVLYGGFNRRPWGKIYVLDAEALRHFPAQIASWRSNYRPPMP